MTSVEDRVVGVLLGLAAGDQIGGPVRMALRVAESLRDRSGFDASDLSHRYLEWWREGAFDTGPTVAGVMSLVDSGIAMREAAQRTDEESEGMTAGCNPAHRSAPLAMCVSLGDAVVGEAAVREARLTHAHPLAGDVAAAVVRLCRALIRGRQWRSALRAASEGRSEETRAALEISSARSLSAGGFAPHALAAAVHFVDSSETLGEALESSIRFAGGANYCPVIVGSIGGARWGRGHLTDRMLSHHQALLDRLTAVATALAARWPAGEQQRGKL